jgi:hypothetical protein
MEKKGRHMVSFKDVEILKDYLERLLSQKRFDDTDEEFVYVGERIVLEEFKGFEDAYSFFGLNTTAHEVYDTFKYKKIDDIKSKDYIEVMIQTLKIRLGLTAIDYPEFKSIFVLFNEKIDANLMVLLDDSEFSKTMISICRSIKGKILNEIDKISEDKNNYEDPAEREIVEVFEVLSNLDKQNYKKEDHDSIEKEIEKTKKELEEIIGPYNERRYSPETYNKFKIVVMEHLSNMYTKDYSETPEKWNSKGIVR